MSILPVGNYEEGMDVTDLLGIIKYEPQIPATWGILEAKGRFPSYIPKTDEIRIQSVPEVLVRNANVLCYITEKLDGASITVWKDESGELNVASRNINYKPSETNLWWKVVNQLRIGEKLFSGYAIQGEVIGVGIQKNRYQLKGNDIRWFNVYDINLLKYLRYMEAIKFIEDLKLSFVPWIDMFNLSDNVDSLVERAKGKSELADIYREGIVIRSMEEINDLEIGRLSFKVLNPDYLLKYEE